MSGWITGELTPAEGIVVTILVHSSWQIPVFVLFAEIVRAVGCVKTPEARYVLSLVTLVMLVAAPVLTTFGTVRSVSSLSEATVIPPGAVNHLPSANASDATITPDESSSIAVAPSGLEFLPDHQTASFFPSESTSWDSADTTVDSSDLETSSRSEGASSPIAPIESVVVVTEPSVVTVAPISRTSLASDAQAVIATPSFPIATIAERIAVTLWFLGMTISVLVSVTGWLRLRQALRQSRPWTGPLRRDFDRRLMARLGLPARTVSGWSLRLHDGLRGEIKTVLGNSVVRRRFALAGAFAQGTLRPAIFLPAAWLTELPADVIEAVLLHEIAHCRRGDTWVIGLERAVTAILFFHPGLWWVRRRLRDDREECCDAWAVARLGDRLGYAMTLETIGRRYEIDSRPRPTAAFLGGKRMRLLHRVRAVLSPDDGRPRGLGVVGAAIAPLSVLMLVGFMLAIPTAKPATADEDPAQSDHVVAVLLDDNDDDKSEDGDRAEEHEHSDEMDHADKQDGDGKDGDDEDEHAAGEHAADGDHPSDEAIQAQRERIYEEVEKLNAHEAQVRAEFARARAELAERSREMERRMDEEERRLRIQQEQLQNAAKGLDINVQIATPRGRADDRRPAFPPSDRERPDRGPRPEGFRPDGPPPGGPQGGPPELIGLLREMRQELGQLRAEVGELRHRLDTGLGRPDGPPRGEGRPPGGPEMGDRPMGGPGRPGMERPDGPPRPGADRPPMFDGPGESGGRGRPEGRPPFDGPRGEGRPAPGDGPDRGGDRGPGDRAERGPGPGGPPPRDGMRPPGPPRDGGPRGDRPEGPRRDGDRPDRPDRPQRDGDRPAGADGDRERGGDRDEHSETDQPKPETEDAASDD